MHANYARNASFQHSNATVSKHTKTDNKEDTEKSKSVSGMGKTGKSGISGINHKNT